MVSLSNQIQPVSTSASGPLKHAYQLPDEESDSDSVPSSQSTTSSKVSCCTSHNSDNTDIITPVYSPIPDRSTPSTPLHGINDHEEQTQPHLPLVNPQSNACISNEQQNATPSIKGYKLVGDNVNKCVEPRYMRTDRPKSECHYYHIYAVKNHIDFSHLSNETPPPVPPTEAKNSIKRFLPTASDDECLYSTFKIYIADSLLHFL